MKVDTKEDKTSPIKAQKFTVLQKDGLSLSNKAITQSIHGQGPKGQKEAKRKLYLTANE